MDYSKRLFKDYRKLHTLQSGIFEENEGMYLFNGLWERDYERIFNEIINLAAMLGD